MAAVYVRNRCPSSVLNGKVPLHLYNHCEVDLSNLKVFGCVAHIQVPVEGRKKLDPRAKRVMFIGYPDESKAWKFVDPCNPTKIIRSRDAVFSEHAVFQESDNTAMVQRSPQ